jgi:hypothetical protein
VSVLLIGAGPDLGAALIRRLIAQDDEIRVVESDADVAALWRSLGAHVAMGEMTDADLIERAAQSVRTVVLFEAQAAAIEPVVQGASSAHVGRLVLCSPGPEADAVASIRASSIDHVVLRTGGGRRRWWGGRDRFSNEAIAEAIDAADDLAGAPKLDLDLGHPAAWRQLGLEAPPNVASEKRAR